MSGLSSERVRVLFAQEADVRLAELGRRLLLLEEHGDDAELVRSIYRELHTLKGSAAIAGLPEISQRAHDLEERVEHVRAGREQVTAELVDALLRGTDELARAVSAAPAEPAGGQRAAGGTTGSRAAEQPSGAPSSRVPPASPATPAPALTVVGRSRSGDSGASPGAASSGASGGTVMVPIERLEDLTRLVGETASAHLRIGRMLKDRFNVDPATCTEFNELSRSLNNLHDSTMRTQMVPVSNITGQLQRAVRDLARTQGKDVRWEAVGTDTELDRGVLQRLSETLLHLVRNAVDHGIEPVEERVRSGKPAQATLRLHAMQLGSDVIITVSDDGQGIDPARVEHEASRLGIETEGLSDQELQELIFHPGLSTARFVSDLSGRGVGLDVVRTQVEAAHGRVDIRSEAGVGTEFRIMVPITVAVLRCLLVEAGGQEFALPFHRVLLTQAHNPSVLTSAEGRPAVWVDRHPVRLQRLADVLGLGEGQESEGPVVVVADSNRRHAFVVDRLVGQRDVVIKPLSPVVPHLPAVAGASVEADGSILVVLDPPGLIERALGSPHAQAARVRRDESSLERRTILVVDDALIIRELQRGILERAGYDVRLATDGQHALSELARDRSDLVVTDIEMPKMDGFALTEAIRAHPTLANIPVLIVSSRASEEDRQRGLDAGADGYITKSAFDESSLLTAVNRLLGASA